MNRATKAVLWFMAWINLIACSSPLISVTIDRSSVSMGEVIAKESPQQKQTKEQ